jgi:DNA invertase Pin-like site-specific DNA recombinase
LNNEVQAMKVAIYARVSTIDQNYDGQLEELRLLAERSGWELVEVYSEKVSGTKETEERPELKRMMRDARWRKFEKVLVWSVDRLGRSMKNLVLVLNELKELKIDIFAYKQAIDTTTAMGSMFFQFLGIFSEFENTIRKERQIVGIRKAKERGVRFGRKPTTEAQIAKIRWMRKNGSSIRAICAEVKVSPNTVYGVLGEA